MSLALAGDRSPRTLAASDGAALVLFAVAGLVSHRGGVSAEGLARDALPLLGGWFAAALAVGLYRRGTPRALLATWAFGIPAGVLVRALVLGRALDGREAAFLATSLVFSLALLLALRLALVARVGKE